MVVEVGKMEDVEFVVKKLQDMGYQTTNMKEYRDTAMRTVRMLELLLGGIGLISFLVAAIGISNTIEWLEEYNKKNLWEWQSQSWLKGELGVIFDEDGEFELSGKCLKYDNEYGLREV